MLSLNQSTGYAVLALGCIHTAGGKRVLSNQVQQCTGISMPYLRKVLYHLRRAGLIKGKRGYRGGFVLARPAETITLFDVMQALGTKDSLPECLLQLSGCSDETPCPMRPFWKEERARIEAALRRVTIAEAAESVKAAHGGRLVNCSAFPVGERVCSPADSVECH